MTFLGEINELYSQQGNFGENLIPTLNNLKVTSTTKLVFAIT